jgi:hypothetical protein
MSRFKYTIFVGFLFCGLGAGTIHLVCRKFISKEIITIAIGITDYLLSILTGIIISNMLYTKTNKNRSKKYKEYDEPT